MVCTSFALFYNYNHDFNKLKPGASLGLARSAVAQLLAFSEARAWRHWAGLGLGPVAQRQLCRDIVYREREQGAGEQPVSEGPSHQITTTTDQSRYVYHCVPRTRALGHPSAFRLRHYKSGPRNILEIPFLFSFIPDDQTGKFHQGFPNLYIRILTLLNSMHVVV